ncbi:MAG: DUF1292 domain-containing protein [Clostridia bacterium]|jgi:hypothetical protein|nr:DUF1292 domain-containing protein [Clostridia bacterium]
MDNKYEIIKFKDMETNETVNFVVLDAVDVEEEHYYFVIEEDKAEDDDAEVLVLRSLIEDEDEVTFDIVSNDEILEKVLEKFNSNNNEFEID